MDETTGLQEQRARTIVTVVLLAEMLWVFFSQYLPLDAGLWALQPELIHAHLTGHVADSWRLIPYPASNIGSPFFASLFAGILPGEVILRFLLAIGGIFLRGMGILALFRTLRVRDAAIYFLIPVLAMTGLWYSGAMPYILGETMTLWVLAFVLSQEHPRVSSFWVFSIGALVVSLLDGLVFLFLIIVMIMILREQRRSVHLSQGWLAKPRSVFVALLPGIVVLVLGMIGGEPIFRLSATHLLPTGLSRLLFLLTPAPDVLEATFRYGNILHALLELLFFIVLLGCFARAYLLAMEEVTWQSRSIRSAGYLLLLFAFLGPLLAGVGIETSSGIILAVVLILGGSYSRGPAVRRTPVDRLLYTLVVVTAIASISINAFSIYAGSAAANKVLRSTRMLATDEPETVAQNEHIPEIHIRFVMDSTLVAQAAYVGSFSYSATVPIYLFSKRDFLADPSSFQPPGGMVRTKKLTIGHVISPATTLLLGSEDSYVDSSLRILAVLPRDTRSSNVFGPFALWLKEDEGINVAKGEANYRVAIGKLMAGHQMEMAER